MTPTLSAYNDYPDYLITSPAEAVIQVLINRPENYNTFTGRMWRDFGRIMRQISHDADYRAVILSATGTRGFSAGLDLEEASQGEILNGATQGDPGRRAAKIRRYIHEFQAQLSEVEHCEKPVVCALFATSYGIAVDIACCCDVRICTEDTVFSVKEIDVGIAADLGTLTRLPKIVGSFGWSKYVCMSGSPFKAQEALDHGFVTQVYPSKDSCLEGARAMAVLIASKSPVATTAIKAIMNHGRDHTVDQSLHYTGVWNAASLQTEDVSRAIMSFKSKKKPKFAKL
ncbi:ClpP/crotonase [Xylariaceae sp. FL0662B]|nr:ClpP/crotonase [Xylariaceae sp. FL0662B]